MAEGGRCAAPSRADAERWDAADPLAGLRDRFLIDDPDVVYLDGNSLGRPPAGTAALLDDVVRREWGTGLVRSWETWIDWGGRLGDRLAEHVLGARPGEVVVADGTSVNLYKLAAAALDARPERGTIVMDAEEFPTDRYVLQGLAAARGLKVRTVASDLDSGVDLDRLREALDDDVALLVLSLVNYRSGALLDMAAVNAAAARAGALVLWDLCHAAGSVPVDLHGTGAALAVGCTYKYLSGGPGAPAFQYVRADLQASLRQPIWGWYGQREMFRMAADYDPVPDSGRFLVGTPPILSLAAVAPALDLVVEAGVPRIRDKAVRLGELVVALADAWLAGSGFRLASPRDPARRGGHVSLAHPDAWRVCRALAARGVICDYRVPDRLRIGPAPLYTRFTDVWDGMRRLAETVALGEHESLPREPARIT